MIEKVKTSRIPGFFKLDQDRQIRIVKEFADLTNEEVEIVKKGLLNPEIRNKMIENVIGTFPLPYAVAVNLLINGKDYLVPMVIEEPSVVAAACGGAKIIRENGGITAETVENLMIGQIYIVDLTNPQETKTRILAFKEDILEMANQQKPSLVKRGGGAKDLEVQLFGRTKIGPIIRIHLLIDPKDAMGANMVNTMTEGVAPLIERIVNGKVLLSIVSNLADRRLVKVQAKIDKESLNTEEFSGKEIIKRILQAQAVAEVDIYRAVTNNKGIMNGMDAVALATGNDWRAIEAGAHGFAAKSGRYRPLVTWRRNKAGNLTGEMLVPLTVGTVGGVTRLHSLAEISLKILKVKSASELSQVIAAIGLCQNLGALRALVSEGIQKGHMKLHARNIAMMAGARGQIVEKVVEQMVREGKFGLKEAKEILEKIESK